MGNENLVDLKGRTLCWCFLVWLKPTRSFSETWHITGNLFDFRLRCLLIFWRIWFWDIYSIIQYFLVWLKNKHIWTTTWPHVYRISSNSLLPKDLVGGEFPKDNSGDSVQPQQNHPAASDVNCDRGLVLFTVLTSIAMHIDAACDPYDTSTSTDWMAPDPKTNRRPSIVPTCWLATSSLLGLLGVSFSVSSETATSFL